MIDKFETWSIGNGETTDALNDSWAETSILLKNYLISKSNDQNHLTVVGLVNHKGW